MLNSTSKEFLEYGYKLEGDFSDLLEKLKSTPVPETGNIYVRDDESFHNCPSFLRIEEEIYGLNKAEIGYCNGNNKLLNCLEYHTCPEVDIALNDLILLLARPCDIKNGVIDSKDVKAFYIKAGEAVVLYPYTLHFSPCIVDNVPFRCQIILSDHTNEDLDVKPNDPKLWKRNKWLYAHKDTNQAKLGAYVGIIGENIEIK